ncbi:hypothetical protein [Sphingomonas sp.]|jgi:hypothetical protein|uniref:hypothetical protein n=1 Tax=Sphingomonas sp. TaxID=28214 RepID=UPI002ED867F0
MLVAGTATILISGLASAQDAAVDSAKPAKEKKICRSLVPVGSIMPKRFCLTKNEWSRLDDDIGKHTEAKLNARKTTMDRTLSQ